MTKWLRWQIALLADRWPDTCWANLASWARYPEFHEFWEILEMRGRAGFCARQGDVPYCGKCACLPPAGADAIPAEDVAMKSGSPGQYQKKKEKDEMIQRLQQLDVNWVREIYIVSKETMAIADSKRSCWICGEPFRVGDGMTVAGTNHGNKLMHSRCHQTQYGERQ